MHIHHLNIHLHNVPYKHTEKDQGWLCHLLHWDFSHKPSGLYKGSKAWIFGAHWCRLDGLHVCGTFMLDPRCCRSLISCKRHYFADELQRLKKAYTKRQLLVADVVRAEVQTDARKEVDAVTQRLQTAANQVCQLYWHRIANTIVQ